MYYFSDRLRIAEEDMKKTFKSANYHTNPNLWMHMRNVNLKPKK
jgi:hypothetical protein